MKEKNPDFSKANDKQLLNDHKLCHAYWSTLKHKPTVGGRNKEDVFNLHTMIVEEFERRGFKHNIIDSSLDKLRLPTGLTEMVSIPLVHNFISLGGSSVEQGRNRNDIDLIIKQAKRSSTLESLLTELVSEEERQQLHFVYDPGGSRGKHIELYDLCLIRRSGLATQNPTYEFPIFSAPPVRFQDSHRIFFHRSGEQVALLDEFGRSMESDCSNLAELPGPGVLILELSESLQPIDIWRWSTTELTRSFLTLEDRQFFLEKLGFSTEAPKATSKLTLMQPFQPLKTSPGYGRTEFNDIGESIKNWAMPALTQ